MSGIYDFTVKTIDGKEQSLADYRGFAVLGFPCNQFAGQEPGSDADVKAFCSTNYGVMFPMFSKIEVNGSGRAPKTAPTVPEVKQAVEKAVGA